MYLDIYNEDGPVAFCEMHGGAYNPEGNIADHPLLSVIADFDKY